MEKARPLPDSLVRRYHGWKATTYANNAAWFQRLSDEGQRPRTMVISCCDSRVHPTSLFGAEEGEFFVHRNIAALVPPYSPDGAHRATSAAVEFAVTNLKVSNLIVLGHARCGGVAACHEMAAGRAPELEQESSFVGRWLDILTPGLAMIEDAPEDERMVRLEKAAVLLSIQNLAKFPFIVAARDAGKLAVHGLWVDIGTGILECWDPTQGKFMAV